MLVPIAEIRIGKRLRQPRGDRVAALADSIRQIGLQQPISLTSGAEKLAGGGNGVTFDLVAGWHRLEACRSLGWDEIEASIVQMSDDERQLWEIDENLCRADLSELERGEHLAKRKEVYERLHPASRQHIAGAVAANEAMGNATAKLVVASFVSDTAARTEASETAIRRSIRRVGKIDEKVRDRIRDNPEIADSGVELDALAALEPQQQRRAVALVEAGQAAGIRDAKRLIEPRKVTPHFKSDAVEEEREYETLVRAWSRARTSVRERFTGEYLDRPVADSTIALRAVT